jgi:hypothetical protein
VDTVDAVEVVDRVEAAEAVGAVESAVQPGILPQTPVHLFWRYMAVIGSCRVFRWRSWSMT